MPKGISLYMLILIIDIKEDTTMTEDDKIAIFKYGIIAPVINDSTMNQKRYFEKEEDLSAELAEDELKDIRL